MPGTARRTAVPGRPCGRRKRAGPVVGSPPAPRSPGHPPDRRPTMRMPAGGRGRPTADLGAGAAVSVFAARRPRASTALPARVPPAGGYGPAMR